MEHNLPVGQFGIKVNQVGPWKYGDDSWQYDFIPTLTSQCSLCAERIAQGKTPSCEKHCQAKCIHVVNADEALCAIKEKRKVVFQAL